MSAPGTLPANRRLRRLFCAVLLPACLAAAAPLRAQPDTDPPAPSSAPLPDVPTLINQVRAHQRQMDAIQENYTFHELDVTQELNKNGSVKKTEAELYEVFYVNTHEVRRQIAKDGRDLSADQQKKEQERVMKAITKAQQTPPGQAPNGEVVISVSRILAVVRVSSPRRAMLDGRSTIAFDFVGDPHAKAHGMAEQAARRTSGTVWIDEQDRQVRRMVVRLDDNVHAGFGLISLGRGSSLVFDQKLVNNELWLPTGADIHLVAHAIGIIGFRANIHVTDNDYQKFHAAAEQLPGAAVVSSPTH